MKISGKSALIYDKNQASCSTREPTRHVEAGANPSKPWRNQSVGNLSRNYVNKIVKKKKYVCLSISVFPQQFLSNKYAK